MRKNKDLTVFIRHPEWYEFVPGVGYVAKDNAPEEVKDAIKRYNEVKEGLREIGRRG